MGNRRGMQVIACLLMVTAFAAVLTHDSPVRAVSFAQVASIKGQVLLDDMDMGESATIELEQGECVKDVYTVSTQMVDDGRFEFGDVPYGDYKLVVWGNQEVLSAEAGGLPIEMTSRPSQHRVDISIHLNDETAAELRDVVIRRARPSLYDANSLTPVALEGRMIESHSRIVVGQRQETSANPGFVAGYLLQDLEEDGLCGVGDRGAHTLVRLVPRAVDDSGAIYATSLISDYDGRFEFVGVLPGQYNVEIWWSPGMIGMYALEEQVGGEPKPSYVGNAFELPVTVAANGMADPREFVIFMKPKPPGLIPYPVSTGGSDASPPVGRAEVGPMATPETTSSTNSIADGRPGDTHDGRGIVFILVVLGLALAGLATVAAGATLRKRTT